MEQEEKEEKEEKEKKVNLKICIARELRPGLMHERQEH